MYMNSQETQVDAKKIAKFLLETKAVFLSPQEPFTWASGIKAPIYCDNRILLSFPEIRSQIIDAFVMKIKENFPNADYIAGVATAGIAHAALIAEKMQLPMIYIRASAKDHGRAKQIEGKLKANAKIVVIEDLISTASSSLQAIKALDTEEVNVLGLCAIFSYNLQKATNNLANAQIKAVTLSNYQSLIQTALEENYINSEELKILENWMQEPSKV